MFSNSSYEDFSVFFGNIGNIFGYCSKKMHVSSFTYELFMVELVNLVALILVVSCSQTKVMACAVRFSRHNFNTLSQHFHQMGFHS